MVSSTPRQHTCTLSGPWWDVGQGREVVQSQPGGPESLFYWDSHDILWEYYCLPYRIVATHIGAIRIFSLWLRTIDTLHTGSESGLLRVPLFCSKE